VVPRVGLDARLTRQMSVGMKAYVQELRERLPRVAPDLDYVAFDSGANFGLQEQIGLPLALRGARLKLVHFMSLYAPLFAPVPSVITIHDLIHLVFPQYFKTKVGPYYRTAVRWACARARRVITDDDRTVDDLVSFLGVRRDKIRVVPLGVDERFLQAVAPYQAPQPYFLYVGNHRAHKDLPTLFAAWSSLPAEHAIDLYVTGPDDFAGELQRRAGGGRHIVALGDVSPDALPAYYAGAVALVAPSLREGFGLPMLEAMAAGCPVVACSAAVPRTIEPAARTFEPRDANGLAARLEEMIRDEGLRARCVDLGQQIGRGLTWDRCARATADVYREVI